MDRTTQHRKAAFTRQLPGQRLPQASYMQRGRRSRDSAHQAVALAVSGLERHHHQQALALIILKICTRVGFMKMYETVQVPRHACVYDGTPSSGASSPSAGSGMNEPMQPSWRAHPLRLAHRSTRPTNALLPAAEGLLLTHQRKPRPVSWLLC